MYLMEQITTNLPWLILWVAIFFLQSYFFQRNNSFASLLILWFTLLIGIFWDTVLKALVPGVHPMWLFGTEIWVLFLILAVRYYLNWRKRKATSSAQYSRETSPTEVAVEETAVQPDQSNKEQSNQEIGPK